MSANPYTKLHRIDVTNATIFSCVTNDNVFATQIHIRNQSPNYVTYRVQELGYYFSIFHFDFFKSNISYNIYLIIFTFFQIMSTSPDKFNIPTPIGWIEPDGNEDVMILTARKKNPKRRRYAYYQFSEIMNEGFTIFALPVFYKTQLDDGKLSVLWRVSDLYVLYTYCCQLRIRLYA